MDFISLGLNKEITDILSDLQLTQPTEVQQNAIPALLQNRDIICRSETGSGKTFAFMLPIIQNINCHDEDIKALVVCPTRELAIQVADETKKIASPLGIKVCAVFGGSNIDRQIKSLKKNPHIVVGTTGRIMDLINKKSIKLERIKYLVLDEADEMLDMGFRPDIEKIISHTNKERVTLLFSATMPKEVKELAEKYQKESITIEIGSENKALDNIEQKYIFVDKHTKKDALKELFFSDVFGKTIVFVNTKKFAEDVAHFLNKNTILCKAIHSDLRQNERKRVLDMFRLGKIDVLVATDVASRGIDIKNVKWVVNFDLPHELEFYVHRIGRTARAGEKGSVINIISSLEQLSQMRDIEKQTKAKINQFETKSENLSQYFVDTKKLAKTKTRYGVQNAEKKSRRFGSLEYLEYEIDDGPYSSWNKAKKQFSKKMKNKRSSKGNSKSTAQEKFCGDKNRKKRFEAKPQSSRKDKERRKFLEIKCNNKRTRHLNVNKK